MRVDLLPILSGKADSVDFSFLWEGAGELFPALTFLQPVGIDGAVTDVSGYLRLTLTASVSYSTPCARCLEPVTRRLTLSLEKNVAPSGKIAEEDDDTVPITDSAVELDGVVEELLFLELPTRDLCSDTCLGLCPVCGKNRNLGDCGCVKKEIDPRLAVLQKFLTDENEDSPIEGGAKQNGSTEA